MNIEKVFPRKWLYAEDLGGKAVTVAISEVGMIEVRNPRTNKPEDKLAVSFYKATKKLIVNKTQAYAIAAIAGKDTDRWPGVMVTLSEAVSFNGKRTILVTPVAAPHTDAGASAVDAGADTVHNPDPDPDTEVG